MIKANKFFFLAGVNDHIVADFRRFDATTLIDFRHERDLSGDALKVEVVRDGLDYVIKYEINTAAYQQSGTSDKIPQSEIFGVVASLANETIQY